MKNLQTFKKQVLQNQKVKQEYDKLTPRYKTISALIAARIERGLTQKELAQKMGTTQSAIARFETGNSNSTLDFLEKAATALGCRITIYFS